MGSTFYHLPHQLLASGFERLMKCYLAVVRKGRDGAYPDRAAMRSLGTIWRACWRRFARSTTAERNDPC